MGKKNKGKKKAKKAEGATDVGPTVTVGNEDLDGSHPISAQNADVSNSDTDAQETSGNGDELDDAPHIGDLSWEEDGFSPAEEKNEKIGTIESDEAADDSINQPGNDTADDITSKNIDEENDNVVPAATDDVATTEELSVPEEKSLPNKESELEDSEHPVPMEDITLDETNGTSGEQKRSNDRVRNKAKTSMDEMKDESTPNTSKGAAEENNGAQSLMANNNVEGNVGNANEATSGLEKENSNSTDAGKSLATTNPKQQHNETKANANKNSEANAYDTLEESPIKTFKSLFRKIIYRCSCSRRPDDDD